MKSIIVPEGITVVNSKKKETDNPLKMLEGFLTGAQGKEPNSRMEAYVEAGSDKELMQEFQAVMLGAYPFFIDLPNSKGSYLKISEGRELLNLHSFFAADPFGPNYEPYLKKLFSFLVKNPTTLISTRISNSDFPTKEVAAAIKLFREFTNKPRSDWYLFFIDGGALAVENAIKAAQDWKVRLNFKKGINKKFTNTTLSELGVVDSQEKSEAIWNWLNQKNIVDDNYDVSINQARNINLEKLQEGLQSVFPADNLDALIIDIKKVLTQCSRIYGQKVIHFQKAFHGRGGYTLSITNTIHNKTKYFAQYDWPRFEAPYIQDATMPPQEIKRLEKLEKKVINQIKKVLEQHGDDIAIMLIEPIQSEGGDRYFRGEFLKELELLSQSNEILFLCDEVQTGMGLTGKPFVVDHLGIEPDMITFGKKSQVCGFFARKTSLDKVKDNVFNVSSRINSTFGGNNYDLVRLGLISEIIMEEKLLQGVADLGTYFLEELQDIQLAYKGLVSNVRGIGLFSAFDLPSKKIRDKLIAEAMSLDLLLLGCGEKTIRFRPLLTVKKEELQEALTRIRNSLAKLI